MAAPTVTFRGKAAIEGIAGTIDCVAYGIKQTGKVTQNFNEEIIQDEHGFDDSWLFRNEHATMDVSLKILGDTAAHAAAPAAVGATSGNALSSLGQPFLAPGTILVFSTFTLTGLNGSWQLLPGSEADLGNTKVADWTLKLRKYANADQQTATATVPA